GSAGLLPTRVRPRQAPAGMDPAPRPRRVARARARTGRAGRCANAWGFLAGTRGRHRCRTFRWHAGDASTAPVTPASRRDRRARRRTPRNLLACAERLVVDVAGELRARRAHRAVRIRRQPGLAEA